ncbi:MAG: hypothetical protein QOJ76_2623 [Acidobacteriota bacterium]|nr:hypothetical protein [Acidobacteriota bacterium]
MAKKDEYADAEPPGQTGNVDLTPHPLVENRADIDDIPVPPDTVSLVGYIGPSKRADYTRLYLDLTFHNYYEIPTSGISATTAVNPDDENSPTHLQVLSDTKLDVITVHVTSVEAKFLTGPISSSHFGTATAFGGGQTAAVHTFCTNITTHFPSCVAPPPCTNITTHMPSCVASPAGGPQFAAPAAGGQQYCTNITTYMPSCVQQPLCTNITTHMPSCVGQGGGPEAAGQIACSNITTYMPSCVAQPQCSPNCVATIVTSHAGPQLDAQAAGQTYCGNITTHFPSCIQQQGDPQFGAQAAGGQQLCANITTYMPSCVGGGGGGTQFCITLYTHAPSFCPPPCHIIAHTAATLCTRIGQPTTVVAQAQAQPNAAQVACITVYTHAPTYCPQQCHPAANTAATLCTQTPRTVFCPTYYTAVPSGCEQQQCHPIANTAATLCTQIHTIPDPRTVICPTVYTATPTGCG